jgi:hypothetical protein
MGYFAGCFIVLLFATGASSAALPRDPARPVGLIYIASSLQRARRDAAATVPLRPVIARSSSMIQIFARLKASHPRMATAAKVQSANV